jgi:hypothetical protein
MKAWRAPRPAGGADALPASRHRHPRVGGPEATKAQEVYEKVEALIASGVSKADAFKQLAGQYGQPVNSIRGSYYQHTRPEGGSGTAARTRRRETTPEDALADARKALERAIESVDREVEQAKTRADEAKAEYDALKASAKERRDAIAARLEALT